MGFGAAHTVHKERREEEKERWAAAAADITSLGFFKNI